MVEQLHPYPVTPGLLPCPLCGEKRISLNKPGFNYKKGSINCPACLLTLPGEVNEDELIRCWNDRADAASPSCSDPNCKDPTCNYDNEPAPHLPTDAQASRIEELERRIVAHEKLQARIVQALGRETWQGDLAQAVEAEVVRANDNGRTCSEAFKVLRAIQDTASETLRMPWLQVSAVPSTHSRCGKCGCETKGESALVNGEVWCHPCADSVPSTKSGGAA